MICFEISLNGKPVFTPGVGSLGTLSAVLQWAKHDPASLPAQTSPDDRKELTAQKLFLMTIGGVTRGRREKEHLSWPDTSLLVGDVVTIKIVEQDSGDPPSERRLDPLEEHPEFQQQYRRLLHEHGDMMRQMAQGMKGFAEMVEKEVGGEVPKGGRQSEP